MTRAEQVAELLSVEELRAQLAATNARVDALERLVSTLSAPANGQAIAAAMMGAAQAPASTNGRGTPKWVDFVRFGGKPCAGGCGTVIASGPQPANAHVWYEPKTATSKAQVFCTSCGTPRAKANGATP